MLRGSGPDPSGWGSAVEKTMAVGKFWILLWCDKLLRPTLLGPFRGSGWMPGDQGDGLGWES